ncbi:hypothetical protein ABFS82_06G137600 [Erythranthe guttata]|uniref:Uncharacterized protein n=1 Tax=Erythranthe guttata TaxID=4155 RepID=A0A022Q740_ERYGU|nr:PREDICTED: uncharacterized protein LOC105974877 [Erythranthe guttata]EYU22345.1 hypothetical protein MIMGU_mgv1a013829mg [Erythranthe guttata]|eukprot:XP_012855489.1 PREDICTED: uncharacterized protein LOC105974877 [Erythranthe guttata]
MACRGSGDGAKLSKVEELELKWKLESARQERKLEIIEIHRQVQQLNKETQSKSKSEKSKLRIQKIVRQVKKLCRDESVNYRPSPKPTDLRISKHTVYLYMFGRPMARLIYDRDFTGYNDPSAVQGFIVYVQIAINAFNKTHSSDYKLVEVVRLFRSLPIAYNYSLYFVFTAKLNDDAKTLQAVLRFATEEIHVLLVDFVDPCSIPRLAI